jgi:hypothetical protein
MADAVRAFADHRDDRGSIDAGTNDRLGGGLPGIFEARKRRLSRRAERQRSPGPDTALDSDGSAVTYRPALLTSRR